MNRSSLYQKKQQSSFKNINHPIKKQIHKQQPYKEDITFSDPSELSSISLKNETEHLHSKLQKKSMSKQSEHLQSEMQIMKNDNEKSKKLKFLTQQQKHVLVGIIGVAIIISLSYALLYLLSLIKQ